MARQSRAASADRRNTAGALTIASCSALNRPITVIAPAPAWEHTITGLGPSVVAPAAIYYHLGIVRRVLAALGADPHRTRLSPFSEPGACRLEMMPE
jgi:hypothetical protein